MEKLIGGWGGSDEENHIYIYVFLHLTSPDQLFHAAGLQVLETSGQSARLEAYERVGGPGDLQHGKVDRGRRGGQM